MSVGRRSSEEQAEQIRELSEELAATTAQFQAELDALKQLVLGTADMQENTPGQITTTSISLSGAWI